MCPAGKLPYGFLDNSAGGGVVGGLDSASLEKQLALSAAFGGAAGLAALTGATERVEVYSRKVFVGGLPPDIDEGTTTLPAGLPANVFCYTFYIPLTLVVAIWVQL